MSRLIAVALILALLSPASAGLITRERYCIGWWGTSAICSVWADVPFQPRPDNTATPSPSLSHYARILIALPFPPLLMIRSLREKH